MEKIGNGSLKLPLNKRQYFTVFGGPYYSKPQKMKGVKLAKEIRDDHAFVSIPTRDFSVPEEKTLSAGLITATKAILEGSPLYVGCMGGRGRTGLFLAILARAFGVKNPVEYVREHYYYHAVETKEQYEFVSVYPIPKEVEALLQKAKKSAWKKFWKKNLTREVQIILTSKG